MENNVNEPFETYGEPLTFEKAWAMFKETDKKFLETEKILKETIKDSDKSIRELDWIFTSQCKRFS